MYTVKISQCHTISAAPEISDYLSVQPPVRKPKEQQIPKLLVIKKLFVIRAINCSVILLGIVLSRRNYLLPLC